MKNKKALITAIVTVVLAIAGVIFGITYTDNDIKEISEGIETVVNIVDNQSTTEIPELTETDEEALEYQETEAEGFELQGEIAYNGASELPKIKVGEYAGLTYYSQIDSRWRNKIYTAIGDTTQTMGSSACGPTCAAMIVSSIKGTFLPPDMADLYVKYGFRSAHNGTYWSAFRWTADVFDIGYKEVYKLDEACELLQNGYYLVTACGNGLFTTGGHFIMLYGYDGTYIKVYDPYLYDGKFNTSTRRGKAIVSGNTVLVTKDNFRAYANYGTFFCFKNDRTDVKENTTTVTTTKTAINTFTSYTAKVTARSGLNARSGAGTSYKRLSGYGYGKIITVVAESNGWGKTSDGYWVCLQYTSKISKVTNNTASVNTTGQYKTFKYTYTYIFPNSNLTGNKHYYLKNTRVKVIKNISSTVDYIYVPATGRYGYVHTSVYK